MSIEVRACKVAEIFDDPASHALFAEYAEECGCALIGKPAPRRDHYGNLEASGMAQAFAAYQDDELCGFAFVLTMVAPHYGEFYGGAESLFVSRRSNCGPTLMKATEDYARSAGCVSFFYSAPVGSRFARLLFLYDDLYTYASHVFCRRLK